MISGAEDYIQCSASYPRKKLVYSDIMKTIIFIVIAFTISKTISFYLLHKNSSMKESIIDSSIFIPKIALQQLALFLFWLLLLENTFILFYQVLITGFVFSFTHFYLLKKLKLIDASLIIIASFVGGIIFTYLYSEYVLGIYIAFLIHLLFHFCLDVTYLILKLGPMKNRK